MKKLVFLSVALATVMLLSCGGGSRHQAEREEDTVDVNDLIRDHTVYGLCGGIPSTSQLRVVTDNGDTLTLDITPAQNDHKMFGSVRVGDRLALMTNKNQTEHTLHAESCPYRQRLCCRPKLSAGRIPSISICGFRT